VKPKKLLAVWNIFARSVATTHFTLSTDIMNAQNVDTKQNAAKEHLLENDQKSEKSSPSGGFIPRLA
jgi:hypothetical protein